MINGIKTLPDGDYCAYCNAKVSTDIYNFCPICGNPLNMQAINFYEQKINREKLNLLTELVSEIKDKNSLEIIAQKTKNINI